MAMSFPRPGKLTHPENVPAFLKNLRWILYKMVRRGNKYAKVPVDWHKISYTSDAVNDDDPAVQGTFDEVVAAMRSNAEGLYGIGCVLERGYCVVFDIDDPTNPVAMAVIQRLLEYGLTYGEISVGGIGQHWIWHGELPEGRNGIVDKKSGLECYGAERFIAITGNRIPHSGTQVSDGRDLMRDFFASLPAYQQALVSTGPTTDLGRSMGLSDQRVWNILKDRRPKTYARAHDPSGGIDFSQTMIEIIGDLDKITGDPGQIRRVVSQCPLIVQGDQRYWRKFNRCFTDWIDDVRNGNRRNTDSILPVTDLDYDDGPSVAHGKAQQANMDAHQARLRAEAAQRTAEIQAQLAETTKNAHVTGKLAEVVNFLSCGIDETLLRDDAPAASSLEHLIQLNTRGMKVPFRKFALLSTVATIGGLLGRKFKTADGISAAPMLMLVAPTASGKGEAFSFWPKQIARLVASAKPGQRVFSHTFNNSASSAQGLHHTLQRAGTTVWMRADAAADIKQLAEPNGATQMSLRDYIYELFDAANDYMPPVSPIASVASDNRSDKPIYNAACSLLWSTTATAFSETYSHDVLATGLGTRMLVTVHDDYAGDSVPDGEVLRRLPQEIDSWLAALLSEIDEIDMMYVIPEGQTMPPELHAAAQKIVRVPYSPDAAALLRMIEIAVDGVRKGVDTKRLPSHYAVFGRTAMQTKKFALISALARNRWDTRIDIKDVEWSLGFVLNCLASLAAMFDKGEVSVKLSDTSKIVLDVFRKLLVTKPTKSVEGLVGVAKTDINYYAQRTKGIMKLANAHRTHPHILVQSALDELTTTEVLDGVQLPSGGRVRAPFIYVSGANWEAA